MLPAERCLKAATNESGADRWLSADSPRIARPGDRQRVYLAGRRSPMCALGDLPPCHSINPNPMATWVEDEDRQTDLAIFLIPADGLPEGGSLNYPCCSPNLLCTTERC